MSTGQLVLSAGVIVLTAAAVLGAQTIRAGRTFASWHVGRPTTTSHRRTPTGAHSTGVRSAPPTVKPPIVTTLPPERVGVTRRRFLNRTLTVAFGTFIAQLTMDALAFLWPNLSGGFGTDVNAGNAQDLLDQTINPDGSVTPVFIPEARTYVVPAPGATPLQYVGKDVVAGGVFAVYQRCTHLGCRVPWCQTSEGFECPCHGSKFNSMGEYYTGPAPRSLDRFVVSIDGNGDLVIKTGQIIQTPRLSRLNVGYPRGPFCVG